MPRTTSPTGRRKFDKTIYPVAQRAKPKTPPQETSKPEVLAPESLPLPLHSPERHAGDDVRAGAPVAEQPLPVAELPALPPLPLDDAPPLPAADESSATLDAFPISAADESDETLDAFPVSADSSPSLAQTPPPRKGRLGILVRPGEPSRITPKPDPVPEPAPTAVDSVIPWNPTGAVIARETAPAEGRLLRRHAPAWAVSGVVHSALVLILVLITKAVAGDPVPPPAADELAVVVEDSPKDPVLDNVDLGLDPTLEAAVAVEAPDALVAAPPVPDPMPDPGTVALANAPPTVEVTPPAGIGRDLSATPGVDGNVLAGIGREGGNSDIAFATAEYAGRSAAGKAKLVKEGGGNDKSEAAVARGLKWVAAQQRRNGSWTFDADRVVGRPRKLNAILAENNPVAATGMSLLPFLAAGYTHVNGPFRPTVEHGLKWLIKEQKPDGSFAGNNQQCMYTHAIATVALCEAYGMTNDRTLLHEATRKAVQHIIDSQGDDGSWGYSPKSTGDTSIVGWQIQALHSAKLGGNISVPDEVFAKARKFLDRVSAGSTKATYGYRGPVASPSMTSVGLLCRNYMDGWTADHPGMADGVKYLLNSPNRKNFDMYFLYYATQVVHFHGGPAWFKEWNPFVRDLLVQLQVVAAGDLAGSWDPDGGTIGGSCGRLGTTCLALLTLEVYYRHLPLYKRDAADRK